MTKAMLLLALLVPTLGTAVERQARSVVLSRAPERPAAGASYLFYLHGRIVEDQGADAVSPDYGRYGAMSQLLWFPGSVRRDPAVEVWMHDHSGELGAIARRWFDVMRACGHDVRELLHDGHPTACVGDAAFAYVNAFRAHVNVGFFRGAEIADPERLLEGTGRFMRHVKLRPESAVDAAALMKLIETAYTDMKERLERSSA